MMQGMSFASLKKHTALIPLFVCVGIGCAGSLFYLGRLAVRNPEVSWNKKGNPEPWQEYEKKQYKFFSPSVDYSKVESPAPKF
ncbi:cytochrome c oxidase subunit NDUFA4 [Halyomorpha halys]|uniref:cytochrome c oxidase subunit NDUFA4 n=1 Tax=Halyomorpha halys TaxID=286706 RepID=UPI0006D4F667|nr:cytochrome c oxidase subunit NDUFA4 [Halyomorpha halys]